MMQQLKNYEMDATDAPESLYNSLARHPSDNNIRKRTSISPGAAGLVPSQSRPEKTEQEEAGMSPLTIMVLLAAHLLRMLYFHGLLLEEQSNLNRNRIHPRALAGDELDPESGINAITFEDESHILSLKPTAMSMINSLSGKTPIQYDLFGQSCSMIIVQVMLLHAMMRLRRKRLSRLKRTYQSSDDIPSIPHSSSSSSSGHNVSTNGAQQILECLSPQPFWQRQFEKITRGVRSHVLHLVSPSNILKHHTFVQYMELVGLSSMLVKLIFDYHWYPMYRMGIVENLKHASILLESCLALPQAIKNHAGKTTKGLSLVMVLGWISGDFFKLCYFLLGMISANDNEQTIEHDGNNVFAMGCLLALMMDLIVVMQMLLWYPTSDVLHLRERITQSIRHWKTNKDDDAGKSLLINNQGGKGLFASAVHLFYGIFRKQPFTTSNQLDS